MAKGDVVELRELEAGETFRLHGVGLDWTVYEVGKRDNDSTVVARNTETGERVSLAYDTKVVVVV